MPKNMPFEVAIRAEPPQNPTSYYFDLWVGEDDLILQDIEITAEQYQKLKDIGIVEV